MIKPFHCCSQVSIEPRTSLRSSSKRILLAYPSLTFSPLTFSRQEPQTVDVDAYGYNEALQTYNKVLGALAYSPPSKNIAQRVKGFFTNLFQPSHKGPAFIANLTLANIKMSYPTHFEKFQSGGYLTPGVIITVNSLEDRALAVKALQEALHPFTPVPDPENPERYYRYFNTPIELFLVEKKLPTP